MKRQKWVLVANSSYARIFRFEKKKLIEVRSFSHPESRLHERDLVSAGPGMSVQSISGSPHPMAPQKSQKEIECEHFAKEVVDFLQHSYDLHLISSLILIAGPSFLGRLRHMMSKELHRTVLQELDKDVVHLEPEGIIEHIGNAKRKVQSAKF